MPTTILLHTHDSHDEFAYTGPLLCVWVGAGPHYFLLQQERRLTKNSRCLSMCGLHSLRICSGSMFPLLVAGMVNLNLKSLDYSNQVSSVENVFHCLEAHPSSLFYICPISFPSSSISKIKANSCLLNSLFSLNFSTSLNPACIVSTDAMARC